MTTTLAAIGWPDLLVVVGLAYAAVIGVRQLASGQVTVGLGLLAMAIFGTLSWAGAEVDLPIKVESETVDAPLLRTLAELGAVVAGAGIAVNALRALRTYRGQDDFLRFHRTLIFVGVIVLGLIALYEWHFAERLPIRTTILSLGGAAVFIVGLAMQTTLGNMFAGYELQSERIIRKGDMVQMGRGGVIGHVAESTLRTTSIVTRDGQWLVLRNQDILAKDFMVLDRPTRALRQLVPFGVAYEAPPAIVKDVALGVLRGDPHVMADPAPWVELTGFGDSSISYSMRFWIADVRVEEETLDRVRTRLWYALRDAGIDIPFPIRTVRMTSMDDERARAQATEDAAGRAARTLAACDLFDERAITSAERREIARDAVELVFGADDLIVRRGDRSDTMFVVAAGTCTVRLPDGGQVRIPAGGHFGEIALMRQELRTADVVAGQGGATVLRLPRPSVAPVLLRRPDLRDKLGTIVQERLEATGILPAGSGPKRRANPLLAALRFLRPW